MHNWKYPGLDKLLNFWIKRFSVIHEELTRAINDTIKNPKNNPYMVNTWHHFPTFKRQRFISLPFEKTIPRLLVFPQYIRFLRLCWQIGSITTYS